MKAKNSTMTENHAALGQALRLLLRSCESIERPKVLLLSPVKEDVVFVKGVVPNGHFYASERFIWDINDRFPGPGPMFDIIIVSNVFHYSPDPEKWFVNVFGATRYLVIQDLVDRKRSGIGPFLGPDGDRVRYSYPDKGVVSTFPDSFDLGRLGEAVMWYHAYAGGRNTFHPASDPAPRHFVLIAKGPLAEARYLTARGELKYKLCLLGIQCGVFYRALKGVVERVLR